MTALRLSTVHYSDGGLKPGSYIFVSRFLTTAKRDTDDSLIGEGDLDESGETNETARGVGK